jgi:predicted nuclease of predicted toxin-antitoxin system
MAKYLVDVNLPYRFKLWNGPDFIYVKDIDERMSDTAIWKYARENELIIVTKDSDFSNRILSVAPPPKVIHIRFGNLKMKPFESVISKFWDVAVELSAAHKVVFVYADRVECIQ